MLAFRVDSPTFVRVLVLDSPIDSHSPFQPCLQTPTARTDRGGKRRGCPKQSNLPDPPTASSCSRPRWPIERRPRCSRAGTSRSPCTTAHSHTPAATWGSSPPGTATTNRKLTSRSRSLPGGPWIRCCTGATRARRPAWWTSQGGGVGTGPRSGASTRCSSSTWRRGSWDSNSSSSNNNNSSSSNSSSTSRRSWMISSSWYCRTTVVPSPMPATTASLPVGGPGAARSTAREGSVSRRPRTAMRHTPRPSSSSNSSSHPHLPTRGGNRCSPSLIRATARARGFSSARYTPPDHSPRLPTPWAPACARRPHPTPVVARVLATAPPQFPRRPTLVRRTRRWPRRRRSRRGFRSRHRATRPNRRTRRRIPRGGSPHRRCTPSAARRGWGRGARETATGPPTRTQASSSCRATRSRAPGREARRPGPRGGTGRGYKLRRSPRPTCLRRTTRTLWTRRPKRRRLATRPRRPTRARSCGRAARPLSTTPSSALRRRCPSRSRSKVWPRPAPEGWRRNRHCPAAPRSSSSSRVRTARSTTPRPHPNTHPCSASRSTSTPATCSTPDPPSTARSSRPICTSAAAPCRCSRPGGTRAISYQSTGCLVDRIHGRKAGKRWGHFRPEATYLRWMSVSLAVFSYDSLQSSFNAADFVVLTIPGEERAKRTIATCKRRWNGRSLVETSWRRSGTHRGYAGLILNRWPVITCGLLSDPCSPVNRWWCCVGQIFGNALDQYWQTRCWHFTNAPFDLRGTNAAVVLTSVTSGTSCPIENPRVGLSPCIPTRLPTSSPVFKPGRSTQVGVYIVFFAVPVQLFLNSDTKHRAQRSLSVAFPCVRQHIQQLAHIYWLTWWYRRTTQVRCCSAVP